MNLGSDVGGNADSLVQRAEDMLFVPGVKDMSLADLRTRANTTPRWPWLPPKCLQDLIRIACSRGRWRHIESDGRVLIGPFEAERTSVRVVEEHYDDTRGEAKLRVLAENAGDFAIIQYAFDCGVTEASPSLDCGAIPPAATSTRQSAG